MKRKMLCTLAVLTVLMSGCAAPAPEPTPTPTPPTTAEWRGVWVSYLELDALLADADAARAAERLDAVMDTCRERGMNTVLFHARAHSDAYYASAVFPPADAAAALLTEGFDPLAYAIEAAHARGLTLHAWVNPYRIGDTADRAVTAATFVHEGTYYYDPADEGVKRAVLEGIRELLVYGVDGIHFDDYFYPAGLGEQTAFEQIPAGVAVADWRRTQVDTLVSAVSGLVRRADKVFGISPIGLPDRARNSHYADVAAWMAGGSYIDYICPQIYYGFEHEDYPYTQTLAAWASLPRDGDVALYVGLALYKAGSTDDPYAGSGRQEWAQHEDIIARQIDALRGVEGVSGFALFRYAHLAADTAAVRHLLTRLEV